MSAKKKSIADTFIELINPAPVSFDPEDDLHPDTIAKVVEYEDSFSEEERPSATLRKRNVDLIEEDDERYGGTKVSRKRCKMLKGESDNESDGSNEENFQISESEHSRSEDSEEYSDEIEEDNQDESKVPLHSGDSEDESNFQHISNRSTESETEKGNAVRNQLTLWDNLLECRIQLQKTLTAANRLPQCDSFQQFSNEGGSKFKADVQQTKRSLTTLLEKLIYFQTKMLKSYPETRNLNRKLKTEHAREMEEEICSDTDVEGSSSSDIQENDEEQKHKISNKKHHKVEDYSRLLAEQHKQYVDYRNATIQKWNDKTRISLGKLSSRNFSSFEQSTVKQIEQILSNRQRLIQRSQLKRSSYDILGQGLATKQDERPSASIVVEKDEEQSKEYNTEIFDDTDFYHQLLRELIERKSSDVTDPVQLGRQWIELQKLRSKMKRKIDTRATKGRKIRYVVHPKLVNFMAPVSQKLWNEEAKTELYNSLFGCNRQKLLCNNVML